MTKFDSRNKIKQKYNIYEFFVTATTTIFIKLEYINLNCFIKKM